MHARTQPSAADAADADHRSLRLRAGVLSLVVGSALFLGKLAAWRLTLSTAILSDALESVINVVAAALLLASLVVAARPADRNHPYGHGKVEFFSAGVEGTCIALAAVAILVESARALLRGPTVQNLDAGLGILLGAGALNGLLGAYVLRAGRRTGSLALVADGKHILTDVWTSVGVGVGLVTVWATGWTVLDPLVAMAVALNILATGFGLMRQAVGGLMDEAEVKHLAPMVEALERSREPGWIDVHGLRCWRSGSVQHVDLHLVVPRYLDVERVHAIDARITDVLLGAVGLPGDVIVHFDPCRPRQCAGCDLTPCPVRAAAFTGRTPWRVETATREDPPVGPPPREPSDPAGASPGPGAPDRSGPDEAAARP